jgi:hypothetical protein
MAVKTGTVVVLGEPLQTALVVLVEQVVSLDTGAPLMVVVFCTAVAEVVALVGIAEQAAMEGPGETAVPLAQMDLMALAEEVAEGVAAAGHKAVACIKNFIVSILALAVAGLGLKGLGQTGLGELERQKPLPPEAAGQVGIAGSPKVERMGVDLPVQELVGYGTHLMTPAAL